jgi:hypothetical protein
MSPHLPGHGAQRVLAFSIIITIAVVVVFREERDGARQEDDG